jgi:hypothetical protein
MRTRLRNIKPAIGTTNYWNKEFVKSVENKKNLCKYLKNNH